MPRKIALAFAVLMSMIAAAPAFALNPQPEPPGVTGGSGSTTHANHRLPPGPC
jgi:hypothetical protein